MYCSMNYKSQTKEEIDGTSEWNPEAIVSKLAHVELSIERRRDNNLSMTMI